jgi:hypothetical protein
MPHMQEAQDGELTTYPVHARGLTKAVAMPRREARVQPMSPQESVHIHRLARRPARGTCTASKRLQQLILDYQPLYTHDKSG